MSHEVMSGWIIALVVLGGLHLVLDVVRWRMREHFKRKRESLAIDEAMLRLGAPDYETPPTSLKQDLNALRAQRKQASNWWDDLQT